MVKSVYNNRVRCKKLYKPIIAFVGALTLAFILLFLWALFSSAENFPNKLWQYSFWRFPITERVFLTFPEVRERLGFVYHGDDKYDFLNQTIYKDLKVALHIDSDLKVGENFDDDVISVLDQVIVGKEITVERRELSILMDEVEKINKINTSSRPTKVLDVYLISYSKIPERYRGYTGLAYGSSTILLFENPQLTETYNRFHRRSVFAHEFGHLLGLKHVEEVEGCVMDPYIGELTGEVGAELSRYFEHIMGGDDGLDEEQVARYMFPYKYCEFEMEKISRTRKLTLINFKDYPGEYYYLDEIVKGYENYDGRENKEYDE